MPLHSRILLLIFQNFQWDLLHLLFSQGGRLQVKALRHRDALDHFVTQWWQLHRLVQVVRYVVESEVLERRRGCSFLGLEQDGLCLIIQPLNSDAEVMLDLLLDDRFLFHLAHPPTYEGLFGLLMRWADDARIGVSTLALIGSEPSSFIVDRIQLDVLTSINLTDGRVQVVIDIAP